MCFLIHISNKKSYSHKCVKNGQKRWILEQSLNSVSSWVLCQNLYRELSLSYFKLYLSVSLKPKNWKPPGQQRDFFFLTWLLDSFISSKLIQIFQTIFLVSGPLPPTSPMWCTTEWFILFYKVVRGFQNRETEWRTQLSLMGAFSCWCILEKNWWKLFPSNYLSLSSPWKSSHAGLEADEPTAHFPDISVVYLIKCIGGIFKEYQFL